MGIQKRVLKLFLSIFLGLIVALFALYFFIPEKKFIFNDLDDLDYYALNYKEDQKGDFKNWRDPKFTNFYWSTYSSFHRKLLRKLRLNGTPLWSIDSFDLLLKKVIKSRGTSRLKNLQKTTKEQRYFIWGDLYGSFHSFVRSLKKLHKMKVITKDLTISPDVTFLFLGDMINRSPFSLETLNVICLLLEKNPDKVLYLKGLQESNGYWENFTMYRQLQNVLCGTGDHQKFEMIRGEINQLFNSLPETLIIKKNGSTNDKILFSHFVGHNGLLDKNVKAIVTGDRFFDFVKEYRGLEFFGYNHAAAQWMLFSAQSKVTQRFFDFCYDSFAEIVVGDTIDESLLIFHSRDMRKEGNFKKKIYDLQFASEFPRQKNLNKGKSIIRIGSTFGLTGILGPSGYELKSGFETAIVNYNGDLKNNPLLKFSVLNDGYVPSVALTNAEALLRDYQTDLFLIPTGTPTLLFYLSMVLQGQISVFFPFTGAGQFRKPEIKNIIHYRASYDDEARSAIKYLISTYGFKKFAFFYQNDSYGRPIANSAHDELKKNGISSWLDLPHGRDQKEFKYDVQKLLDYRPEAIGCFSSYAPTRELLSQLGPEFFLGRLIFSSSFLSNKAFERFLKYRGVRSVRMSVVPDPEGSDLQIVQEYREKINEKGFSTSLNSLEGYISGQLFIDAVKKIGPPYTKDRLMRYFEGLKNYHFKGLTLTFNPEKRDLSQPIWLRTPEEKWIQYKT